MSKKRINIEGLPDHLRKEIMKALKPRVNHYISNIFTLDGSARKHGRNCTATYNALLDNRKYLGPNQSSLAWVVLRYGSSMTNIPTKKGQKLAEEYDAFLKEKNKGYKEKKTKS